MNPVQFTIRPATLEDVAAIAKVHIASIRTIGAKYYGKEIIDSWGAERGVDRYVRAIEQKTLFFLADCHIAGTGPLVGGFSSYRFEEDTHRVAVYVHEDFARHGVGSALFEAAEKAARGHGATEIHVAGSLAAVEFYLKNGFEKLREGTHVLYTGVPMDCVFMRKLIDRHESVPCLSS